MEFPEQTSKAHLALQASTYSVGDLACLFKCSERHVRRLHAEGKIVGAIRIGRLVRFSKRMIDAELAGGSN